MTSEDLSIQVSHAAQVWEDATDARYAAAKVYEASTGADRDAAGKAYDHAYDAEQVAAIAYEAAYARYNASLRSPEAFAR